MRILLVTDSFPPHAGGSGWSTYELARGLRTRGHEVALVQPRPGQAAASRRAFDGFEVDEFPAFAPAVPIVRTYFTNERLAWSLGVYLEDRIRREAVALVHAQHVLSAPGSILAARRAGVPVVCTVRDYWPVCYWSTLIRDASGDSLCPACSPAAMMRCIRPRAGAAWPLALPVVPYMAANLRRKRLALRQADAVIAVSSTMAADLRARAPELATARIERIPNPVDVAALRAAAERAPRPLAGDYALFVGKLERNKGADLLLPAARAAGLRVPLVVVGDGADRAAMEVAARAAGQDVRFTGWTSREETLAWMRHARLLAFPSRGPESLSRVLLEAAALGVPIAAMDTGGTRDIVRPGETGLLSDTAVGLAADMARLINDAVLAARLAAGARAHVEATFDASAVVGRIDRLYAELVSARGGRRG